MDEERKKVRKKERKKERMKKGRKEERNKERVKEERKKKNKKIEKQTNKIFKINPPPPLLNSKICPHFLKNVLENNIRENVCK